jgi:hypothetical protein
MAVQIKSHELRKCRFCRETQKAEQFEFVTKRGFRRSICKTCWEDPETRERYHTTRSTDRISKDAPVRTEYAIRADELFLSLPLRKAG